jgi:hypothetical protein
MIYKIPKDFSVLFSTELSHVEVMYDPLSW